MRCTSLVGLSVVLVAAAGLTACADSSSLPGQRTGRLEVSAAFYPWQFVAEQVGGKHVVVTNLTKPGTEPHDLELSPRQVASLAHADLVLYERGVQPSVDRAVSQQAKKRSLDIATIAMLRAHSGLLEQDPATTNALAGKDPHIWLDPHLLALVVSAVADRMSFVDPAHAEEYSANAAELNHRLNALKTDIANDLSTCRSKVIVTSHTAFGYFADLIGWQQIGVAGIDAESDPSPRRIADVAKLVKSAGALTVYYERLLSPAIAKTVARAAGVASGVLDPIEGATDGKDYFALMRDNVEALRKGQDCP